jgi:hypothetical protein
MVGPGKLLAPLAGLKRDHSSTGFLDGYAPSPHATGRLQQAFSRLRDDLQRHIIGQPHLIDCLLIALLADGHLLVEGAPGLAKTTAVKALALAASKPIFIACNSRRIYYLQI